VTVLRRPAWLSLRGHSRRWWLVAAVLVIAIAAASAATALSQPATVTESDQFVAGTPEPDGAPVRLDTTLFLPASTPAPAILLAHGLGGTKVGMAAQARALAQHGYVVLIYTARGFGNSGGLIHLDSQKYEVADGSRLLDYLQQRPEVLRRGGAPVLGVAGSSYGGALALMLGATDHRVSAVAADITWNNLSHALFPNSVQPASLRPTAAPGTGADGVFKKLWAGYLFSVSVRPDAAGTSASPAITGSACGRFAADVCAFYQQIGQQPDPQPTDFTALLAASSPSSVLAGMRAPTLLTQGEQDSLFPLSEADANARQIAAAGAPVQLRWRGGGHDAVSDSDQVNTWQQQFFDQRLRAQGTIPADGGFLLTKRGSSISATNGRTVDETLSASDGYPGVAGHPAQPTRTLALTGPAQNISAPAGGNPAAVTSLPALGQALGAAVSVGVAGVSALSSLPTQTASFVTAPVDQALTITGSSRVSLDVSGPAGKPGTLFVSLRDIAPDASVSLPASLVAPVYLLASAGAGTVSVQLPWIVAEIPTGHRLAVVVSTTDLGYAMPADPRTYRVSLAADSAVSVPTAVTTVIRSGNVIWWPVTAGIVLLLCAGYLGWRFRDRLPSRSRAVSHRDPELADVPVAVTDLVKEYADGYRAVDGVTFRVERGQVLGLLGPNGAGKTTTLRVLMGLIMPTRGSVRVFGEEVLPGAAVLSSLGAFVEGPGLLPHLSGRENLRLYWAASGRPAAAAELDTVLEIAGLGASLERRVKTYSHGMQQRLAIAQAMLGLPEVLVLDEPTNGLDPPQIAEMREVLHRYAATGRTVIVSSHLLAEVEQTCTHLVVMARGRLVASGSVTEVAGAGAEQLVVHDTAAAVAVLSGAGIAAQVVPGRRALEDVFLDLIGERDD
jgi:ABC-2 type transport system ATP-binding protein